MKIGDTYYISSVDELIGTILREVSQVKIVDQFCLALLTKN